MPRSAWPLSEVVVRFAAQVAESSDHALAAAGKRAQDRLAQPLCVAVVGRMKAGKSTLLNALLETAISPTAGGECTEVVYVFHPGSHTTAVANRRDGEDPSPVVLDGTMLPRTLPIPAGELRNIEVTLPVEWLYKARLVLVDTPGMASTSTEKSALTERIVADTEDAAADADALLFCVNGPLKDDEEAAVRRFKAGRAGARLTGGTAVGVLTRADQEFGADRRLVWKKAVELSRKMSVQHADLFSVVVPVIGLLAETVTTGALRERHARWLGALANSWNPDTTDVALSHVQMFLSEPGPIETDRRQELVDLLGLYGIGELLDAIRAGTPPHAAALTSVARQVSGYDDMSTRLRHALGERADVLKAAAALDDLIARARDAGDHSIRDQAQTLLDRKEMFPLRIMEMAQYLAHNRVRPPAGLAEEAWIAVTTGLPRVSAREGAARAAAWREWATLTDGMGQWVARTMVRAWQLAVNHD
jgi:Dynamin family